MNTLDRKNGRNPNLGFGHVPPTNKTEARYLSAAKRVIALLEGATPDEFTLDAISEVKGICNRILREDQPDWVVIWLWMGLPSKRRLNWMSKDLPLWRNAYKTDDLAEQSHIAERLQRAGLLTALNYFIEADEPPEQDGWGYLYLLSSRADPDLLKIGQTRRDVIQRVEEINRATGVVEPLSARRIWRVKDPQTTERAVHEILSEYRVRIDREFFRLPHHEAETFIEQHLWENSGKVRIEGAVKRMVPERGFGFIEAEYAEFFFHASEVRGLDIGDLAVGDRVSFDQLDTSFGRAAADLQRMEQA